MCIRNLRKSEIGLQRILKTQKRQKIRNRKFEYFILNEAIREIDMSFISISIIEHPGDLATFLTPNFEKNLFDFPMRIFITYTCNQKY